MSKILKDYELDMEGETLYDGEKTLLVNILKSEKIEENKELTAALESVPPSLQKFIISYIENYKYRTVKAYEEKELAVFEEARKKGYSEGFMEGKRDALKSMEEVVGNIFRASESIERFKNELYEDVKQDVINLSLKIAKTIVKAETAADIGLISEIIADAVNKSSDAVNFTICLNPGDYGILNKNPGAIKDFIARAADISFMPDVNLSAGDIIIKTDFGEIDARIETQLEQIKKIFTRVAPD